MIEIAFWDQNQNSYNQVKNMLEKYRNIELGTDSILKVTEYVGKVVFEKNCIEAKNTYNNIANISTVEKEKTRESLYCSIDGCTVNKMIEDENGSTWKENKLGMFFDSNDLYMRKDKSNMIINKTFTTFLVVLKALSNIFITVGATWIRTMLNELFSDTIQILDKFHLLENINSYAKVVFKDNTVKIKKIVKRTYEMIINKAFDLIYKKLKKYENISMSAGTVNL